MMGKMCLYFSTVIQYIRIGTDVNASQVDCVLLIKIFSTSVAKSMLDWTDYIVSMAGSIAVKNIIRQISNLWKRKVSFTKNT